MSCQSYYPVTYCRQRESHDSQERQLLSCRQRDSHDPQERRLLFTTSRARGCAVASMYCPAKRFQARSNTNQESRCPIVHPLEPRADPSQRNSHDSQERQVLSCRQRDSHDSQGRLSPRGTHTIHRRGTALPPRLHVPEHVLLTRGLGFACRIQMARFRWQDSDGTIQMARFTGGAPQCPDAVRDPYDPYDPYDP